MNTIPTFRKGRRRFKPGPRYSGPLAKVTAFFVTLLLVILPPGVLIVVERNRRGIYESLSDISNTDIVELPDHVKENVQRSLTHQARQGRVVHGTSSAIDSWVGDMEMGIKIENALRLSRHTEYCQWQEIKRESCNRCTRTTQNEDGSTETETYDCDCTVEFDYVKTWLPYRLNSYLFDQPAAHYNPQHDPMPSAVFPSKDASMKFNFQDEDMGGKNITTRIDISPDFFESSIRGVHSRPVKWVRNGIPKIPPFWLRWIPDRSRYENISLLSNDPRNNKRHLALSEHAEQFVYVGDGYFFLPHEASTMERLFKTFGEYLEGTLFDWQLGDIMPSCTAGDIRIRYTVQDPDTISILGQLHDMGDGGGRISSRLNIQPFKANNGRKVGLVHEGHIDALSMISKEEWNSFLNVSIFRVLLIFWALAMSRLLGSIFGMTMAKAKKRTQVAFAFCIWSLFMGTVWSFVWGRSTHTIVLMVSSSLFGLFILYNPPPHLKKAPGFRSGWYQFSSWADAGMDLKKE